MRFLSLKMVLHCDWEDEIYSGKCPSCFNMVRLSHSTQISAILPSSMRNIVMNLLSIDLPVGGKSPS